MVLSKIRTLFRDRTLDGLNPDSDKFLARHRNILESKPMMNEIFREFYRDIRRYDEHFFRGVGKRIEVGAGVSTMKSMYPDVTVTDIKSAAHLDMVLDALHTPFEPNSVRALYGINCFHHFPDIVQFFHEMERVLEPGGGVVLIEPYYGFLGRIIYKNLSSSETFDPSQSEWNPKGKQQGVMTAANQALSYLVFIRDRQKFEALFPDLEIVLTKPIKNYSRYLLSGGLNFNQLVPTWMVPILKAVEWALTPVERLFALHYFIVIRKRVK